MSAAQLTKRALALCLCAGAHLALAGALSPAIARRQAQTTTAAPSTTASPTSPQAAESLTALSDCHAHGSDVFCVAGPSEYQISVPATATGEQPASYTGCHSHGAETFCFGPGESEVQVLGYDSSAGGEEGHSHEGEEGHSHEGEASSEGASAGCHFHAGVEHCPGAEGEGSAAQCSRQDRDYNIGLRVGLLFVMLATSLIGVLVPIFLAPALPSKLHVIFTIVKQFGTGIIISTAFVHLFTHASLMFTNQCLGELQYEATTAAILMAGLFLAFMIEYVTHRLAQSFLGGAKYNSEAVSVMVLEAGIIFHSVLIGITVVVAGDSYFATLYVVIVFHQMFEGMALGSRIAAVGRSARTLTKAASASESPADDTDGGAATSAKGPPVIAGGEGSVAAATTTGNNNNNKALSMPQKLVMALCFGVTTPVGMAIGIGVLRTFNGNDPSTLIAIGTLDALSAGILVWIGVVEMWAADWMFGGELAHASPLVATLGGLGLVSGMIIMSVLGKWA